MNAQFARLPARQQLLWLGCTAALVLLCAGGISWQAHASLHAARAELQQSAASRAEMQALVSAFRNLQAERGADQRGADDASLSAVVNASLQGRNFQPSRIQQGAAGELQLRLEEVPFTAALQWLLDLENTGRVSLRAVSVTQGQDGTASLTLTVGGR